MSQSDRLDKLERHFQTLARNQRRELAMHRDVREQNRLLRIQVEELMRQREVVMKYFEASKP